MSTSGSTSDEISTAGLLASAIEVRPSAARASDERLPVIEHHRLPWRRRPERIVQRKRCSTATEARHRALRKGTAMSNARQALHLRTLVD